jgi:predicted RNA polymerase sigma factor
MTESNETMNNPKPEAESRTALAVRIARELSKTQARNPIVSSQAIGPRTARVKAVLKKYGFSV